MRADNSGELMAEILERGTGYCLHRDGKVQVSASQSILLLCSVPTRQIRWTLTTLAALQMHL